MRDIGKLIVEAIDYQFGTVVDEQGPYVVRRLDDGDFEAFSKFLKEKHVGWGIKNPNMWNGYGAPYYYFEKDGEPFGLLHFKYSMFADIHDAVIDSQWLSKDPSLYAAISHIYHAEEPEVNDEEWLETLLA